MVEAKNSERFLNAFSTIEQEMKKILDSGVHLPFFELVNKTSKVNTLIKQVRFDLKEYGELRNAIIHNRTDGAVIAEPNDNVVAHIEKVAKLLIEPPKVTPLFLKEVLTLSADSPVSKAIKDMSKQVYTQAPILEGDKIVGLLTLKMIVQWMGLSLDDNSFDIENTTINDLVDAVDHVDSYELVDVNKSLLEIPDLFYRWQDKGDKLEAVLITQNGEDNEPLKGIITNRDLPLIHRELK